MADSLHRKLFLARKAAGPVDKKGQSESGDYYYARFEDVLAEASRQLEKKGILILPQVVEEKLHFSPSGFAIATVVMEFQVLDTKGDESLTVRWSGTGHDSPGDKASFKAQTGCEKYFLAKLLGIPFGTDPEADADNGSGPSTELVIPPAEEDPEEEDPNRIRAKQDAAAEAPQAPPARHEKPLPKSDHPPAVWENVGAEKANEPTSVC